MGRERLIMLAYLIAHMYGNLKIFFGPGTFNDYAHWLRTLGEPFFHYEWGAVDHPRGAGRRRDRTRRVCLPLSRLD